MNEAPSITTQPMSMTVALDSDVTFSVEATSEDNTLTYQWQFEGNDINAEIGAMYTITGVAESNSGEYRVVVRNSVGPTTSTPATLTVSKYNYM